MKGNLKNLPWYIPGIYSSCALQRLLLDICWGETDFHGFSLSNFKNLENAVLRWLQECLHPECLHRSCGHFGAPWGARNDSRQVQGGDYMAVPRNLRTGRCLDGVHQLLVHALIRGASEGTLPNLLYNTWPESNGIYIYIYVYVWWDPECPKAFKARSFHAVGGPSMPIHADSRSDSLIQNSCDQRSGRKNHSLC